MKHGPADRRELRPIKAKRVKDRTVHDLLAPKKVLGFRVDWRQYFRDFCHKHGGNPVELGGRLVLPDGWQYSCTDEAGPEYPPPLNPAELRSLVVSYWNERRGIVADEVKLIEHNRRGWKELLIARDGELKHARKIKDEATDKWSMRHDSIADKLRDVDYRLKWLKDDLACSIQNIEAVGKAEDDKLLVVIDEAIKPREIVT